MKSLKTVRSPKPFAYSWPGCTHPATRPQRTPPADDPDPEQEPKWLSSKSPSSRSKSYPGAQPDRLFDGAYLIALRDHNQEVESHLVNALARPLWVKLHSRLRSPQLIEDARQETFLRVFVYFRSGKTLQNPASLPGFVLSVCNNVCHEFLRSHTRQDQMPINEMDPLDRGENPEQRVVTEERKQLVANILNHLSTKDRQVLKRVFLDEADKDEVCHELGIDRDYLRLVVHRAKLRFRAVLKGVGFATAN